MRITAKQGRFSYCRGLGVRDHYALGLLYAYLRLRVTTYIYMKLGIGRITRIWSRI